ncbi:hypothetical protein E7Z57_10975 [Ralstonia pseudosolanacearum]|uniref:Uncharacterized protein n=1 Tax=Ralstonia solanacearum TaxID=305 RepID=A0AA92ECL9_RALSL|nr:hypothetical protein E7Z57_10975 [Ralstonia pseudosolanacearum]
MFWGSGRRDDTEAGSNAVRKARIADGGPSQLPPAGEVRSAFRLEHAPPLLARAYGRLPPGQRDSPVLIGGSGSGHPRLAPARLYISDFLRSVLEST